jgi:hypothetical protein
MRAVRKVAVVAAATLVLVAGCKTDGTPQRQPYEDEPGWNCHTMGNHQCGPVDPRS